MSKKTTTTTNQTQSATQANTYDQQSLGAYHDLLGKSQSVLSDYMKNPLESSFFDQRNQMSNQNAFMLASRNKSNILANSSRFSGGDLPAFLQSSLDRNSRDLSANQSNSFMQNLLYSEGLRQQATNSAMNFRPLQTGGTSSGTMTGNSTQTVSGLGTWLPQLAGAAIGGATGGLFGGGKSGGDSSGSFSGGSPWALSGTNSQNGSFIGGMNTYQPDTNNYWKN